MAEFLAGITGVTIPPVKMVELTRAAENEYVGAPSGYLDQGTVKLADWWLYMDYRPAHNQPFTWQQIDVDLEQLGYVMVVGYDPASRHANVDGKYASRRNICEASVPLLGRLLERPNLRALRDISCDEWEQIKTEFRRKTEEVPPRGHVGDARAYAETATRYVTHVVYENERVLQAADDLRRHDIAALGDRMTESGASAINLYDLAEGAPELSFVYNLCVRNLQAWSLAGIRNMGGGFNATTLALLPAAALAGYQTALNMAYQREFGREYRFIDFVPAPASGMLDLSLACTGATSAD